MLLSVTISIANVFSRHTFAPAYGETARQRWAQACAGVKLFNGTGKAPCRRFVKFLKLTNLRKNEVSFATPVGGTVPGQQGRLGRRAGG